MSNQTRVRTQQMHRTRQRAAVRDRRRRRLLRVLGGLVVVGLLVAIAAAVWNATAGNDDLPTVSGAVVKPANLTSDGAIPVGDAAAPVTVEIWFDYMCPACGAFEGANGDELDRLVEEGTARVELRPISFLDKFSSGTAYSTRAANAIATVADAAPDRAWEFHAALYAHQPAEGSEGLSDEQIAAIAADVGVPDDVVATFDAGTHVGWVASATREAFDSGISGTPTVKIDGELFDGDVYSVGPLTEAIETAAAGR